MSLIPELMFVIQFVMMTLCMLGDARVGGWGYSNQT